MPEINLSNKEIDLLRTVDPEMELYGILVTDVKVYQREDRLMIIVRWSGHTNISACLTKCNMSESYN